MMRASVLAVTLSPMRGVPLGPKRGNIPESLAAQQAGDIKTRGAVAGVLAQE